MRITVNQLRRIIKEEVGRVLSEAASVHLSMSDNSIVDNKGNKYSVEETTDGVAHLRRSSDGSYSDFGGSVDSMMIEVELGSGRAFMYDEDSHGATGMGSSTSGNEVSVDPGVLRHLKSPKPSFLGRMFSRR